jgi:hypothetical protein
MRGFSGALDSIGILTEPGREPEPVLVMSLDEVWGGALTLPLTGVPRADAIFVSPIRISDGAALLWGREARNAMDVRAEVEADDLRVIGSRK